MSCSPERQTYEGQQNVSTLKMFSFSQYFCNDVSGDKTCDCLRSIKMCASNWDGRSSRAKKKSNHFGRLR